jgi:hypothetical protein
MRSFFKKPSSSLLQRIQRGCAALAALIFSNIAVAGIVFDVNEVGPDVVATVSGSFASLPTHFAVLSRGQRYRWLSGAAQITIAPDSPPSMNMYRWKTGGEFPTFGTATQFWQTFDANTSTVNTAMQIDGVLPTVAFSLDSGYNVGEEISGTVTWTGKSYSNLRFDPGTYLGTLENDETITLNINAAPVPEPSTGALAALVLGGTALGVARRRRKQGAAATREQAV